MRVSLLWASMVLVACGSGDTSAPTISDAIDALESEPDAPEASPLDASPPDCPSSHIAGPGGACMPVGIQGCDAMFIDPETGLCDPSLVECPPGEIPIFAGPSQGCRPVGVPDCHEDLIDGATGLCEASPQSCDGGLVPIVNEGCVSLDPPGGCGEGTWGAVEELPGDQHVDPSYDGEDSDGSRERPWSMIGYAMGSIEAGGRLVLAAGQYDEPALLSKGIALVGRCSSMVTLSGIRSTPLGQAHVEVGDGAQAAISDVTLTGSAVGVIAHSGAQLWVERVRVVEATNFGFAIHGAQTSVTLSRTWIESTLPNANENNGIAIFVDEGASITATQTGLISSQSNGVWVGRKGSSLVFDHGLIWGTRSTPQGIDGDGVEVQYTGQAVITRSVISNNQAIGVSVSGSESELKLEHVQVSSTQLTELGTGGLGVLAYEGGRLELAHSRIATNRSIALLVEEPGTKAHVESSELAHTAFDAHGQGGLGIIVQSGAELVVERSLVDDNRSVGIKAMLPETSFTVEQTLIRNTSPNGNGLFGSGVQVGEGAQWHISDCAIVDNTGMSVGYLAGSGAVTRSLLARSVPNLNQIADGLIATGSVVVASQLITRDHPRAGILFDKSSGEVTGSLLANNDIGLADQGHPGLTLTQDNVFQDNTQSVLNDGNLAIPDDTSRLPEAP